MNATKPDVGSLFLEDLSRLTGLIILPVDQIVRHSSYNRWTRGTRIARGDGLKFAMKDQLCWSFNTAMRYIIEQKLEPLININYIGLKSWEKMEDMKFLC